MTDKIVYSDDKIDEHPKVEQSALNQKSRGPQKTKVQHAKELRENKITEFEKKRELAKQKI